jgi:signal transduction histidine kinase
MNTPLPLWRRLWVSLPLVYKLVIFGLGTVMMATMVVMAVTYQSAGESLKLQLERQVSRDLNVFETWYRTRLEEMQLTSVGLVRHQELSEAIAIGRLAPAEALLSGEVHRLQLSFALLTDADGRLIGPNGRGSRFDPNGLVSTALARGEQVVATEAWSADQVKGLTPALRQAGLVRLTVTPVGPATAPQGVVILGEWVDARSPVPNQVAAIIGGGIGIMDLDSVEAETGFPTDLGHALPAPVWDDLRAGRYFFFEQDLGAEKYLLVFRPLSDHQGRTIGAFVRGFPESHIAETLHRYAGGILVLSAAAIVFAMLAFLWLTRQLLFPLRYLARLSLKLAEVDSNEPSQKALGQDEFRRLEAGVVKLADRLTQSREDLAEAAFKLEAEAQQLAERNAELGRLNEEKARLLAAIREHDALRGQLLEKIISAQEDERKRIARELHDETGQSLTSLLVGLKYVEGARSLDEMRLRTADLRQLTLQTLEEVHKLSLALRPAMLDDLGLIVALRSLVKDFGAQHGLEARFEADALDVRLPPLYEVTLYRIVQEALTNVAKYADAGRVEVGFRVMPGEFRLSVSDDGVGFEPTTVGGGREHLGLLGMQERVSLLGGHFQLVTAPGGGTRIVVSAPLPPSLIASEGSPSHA